MKDKLLQGLKMVFFLGLGVLLVWLVLRKLTDRDKQDIFDAFLNADYFWVIVTLLLNLTSNISRAIRWQMLIRPSGHNPSFVNTFSALMIGYLANYAVPRLGEVTRCGILKKYEDVPVSTSLGTVVLERVIDVLCLGVMLMATIVWKYDLIASFLDEMLVKMAGKGAGSNLKIILLAIAGILGILVYLFRRKLKAHPVFSKIIGFVKGFWTGLLSIKDLDKPWLFLFHTVYIWVMYLLTLYFGFYTLQQTTGLPFDASLVALVFGTFGMILVQGGIGAYPVMVSQALVLYGVPASIGFAFGWLAWGSQTIMYVLIGVLALIFIPILNQKNYGKG